MKLIRKWIDTKYNVENFLYEDINGLQVLHTLNKQSLDTYASLVVKAGAYFEKQLEVPNGTAHFLEHVLFSPNEEFKTKRDVDEFEFGTKERARILVNASTGFRIMTVYGFSHTSRENDLMKRLSQIICFPMNLVEKNISREKKIILAELQHELKPEKDSMYQFSKFALDGKIHNTDYKVLGKDVKTIKSIQAEHLIKFYTSRFNLKDSIFSIQSPTELTEEVITYINDISKVLKNNGENSCEIFEENLENETRVGFFHNTEAQGLSVALYKFQDNKKRERDYFNDNLFELRNAVIKHIAFDELREKKGYIYHIGGFNVGYLTWDYSITGLEITIDPKHFQKAIEGLNKIIYKDAVKFLNTPAGEKWFENNISSFLFPRTVSYNDEYAQNKSILILQNYEVFDFEKAKAAAERITIKELVDYIEKENGTFKYSYWVDSPKEIKEMKKQIKGINLFKEYTI